ncbi:hypothetical protein EDB85DRAFT_1893713 [Lactarius pseudohatsudake]|nr:hypothetical protein EDB85DRAFT_1893713 [Lactarius pseudohatsudake]
MPQNPARRHLSLLPSLPKSCQRKNLTFNDWLTVSAFIDTNAGISQTSVCDHFHSLASGALEFNQAMLLWKLNKREEVKAYALYLWVKSMEAEKEIVMGCMLCAKMREAQMQGEGWLASFKKVYQICETKKHGEAGSADQAAVVAEQARVWEILAQFTPKDQVNLDETATVCMQSLTCGVTFLPDVVPDLGHVCLFAAATTSQVFSIP